MLNGLKTGSNIERDPVCGMEVKDIIKAPATVYKGRTYYFCTNLCKIQFEHAPDNYVIKSDKGEPGLHHSH